MPISVCGIHCDFELRTLADVTRDPDIRIMAVADELDYGKAQTGTLDVDA